MNYRYLTIRPRDPLIFRDARPFGFGQRMKTLSWPYPSVLAGSLRTFLGKQAGYTFTTSEAETLRTVEVAGPFAWFQNTIWFPAPKDCVIRTDGGKKEIFRVIPMRNDELSGCGCNLPDGVQVPTTLSPTPDDEFKPAQVPPLWSQELMVQWLITPSGDVSPLLVNETENRKPQTISLPPRDYRTHVKIDPKFGSSAESMLFETAGLDFTQMTSPEGLQITARVNIPPGDLEQASLCGLHPFGGKRRLAEWNTTMNAQSWACPDEVTAALCRSRLVRLVLATPALFTNGWYPGWLSAEDGYRTGRPPGADETVQLRLISACIGRYEPLSGWNMERVNNKEKGAKPLRRMVPAGSVYYFEYIGEGDPKTLANLWLMSVCDNEPDRLDGFGLALWGIWEYGTDVDGVV